MTKQAAMPMLFWGRLASIAHALLPVYVAAGSVALPAQVATSNTAQEESPGARLSPRFFIADWEADAGPHTDYPFLANPVSVAIDGENEIFVLDAGNHRIAVFSEQGGFLREFGDAGHGPGEFNLPRVSWGEAEIAVSQRVVFVLDPTQRRIHRFSSGGEFLGSMAFSARPITIAAAPAYLFVGVNGFDAETEEEIAGFGLDGEPARGGGATLLEKRAGPISTLSRANASRIAATDEAIIQVYRFFPLLRLHTLGGATKEILLDSEDSWSSPARREDLPLARAFLAAARSGADLPALPRPYFYDAAYVPGADSWAILAAGNRLLLVDAIGDIEHEIFLSMAPHASGILDIGVSADGSMLCAADPSIASLVACYGLEEFQ